MKRFWFSGLTALCILFFVLTAFISNVNAIEPGLVKASCSSTCSSVLISYQEDIESSGWEGIFQVQKEDSILFNEGSYADSMFIWQTAMKNVAFITHNTHSGENAGQAIAIVNDFINAYYPDMVTVVVLSDTDNDGEADTSTFSESLMSNGSDDIMVNP